MELFDKKLNKIINVFSFEEEQGSINVQYKQNGTFYKYSKDRLNIPLNQTSKVQSNSEVYIYKIPMICYKCQNVVNNYTYITFSDSKFETVTFPWKKERLLKSQDFWAHMQDSHIEYYGINVLGDIPELDEKMEFLYPTIKYVYSVTQHRKYHMNHCNNCKAKQGQFFIFEKINLLIQQQKQIEIVSKILI